MKRLALLPFGGDDDAGLQQLPDGEGGEGQDAAGQEEERQGVGEELLPLEPADLSDLRRWLRLELASELERSGAVHPLLVELDSEDMASTGSPTDLPDPGTLGDIAGAAGLEFAAAVSVDSGWGAVRVRLVVAGAEGEERLQEQAVAPYEELAEVPQALARAVLLAIGEEAAAPATQGERPVPIDALLLLCRASRQLDEAQLELERAAEEPPGAAPGAPPAMEAAAGAPRPAAAAAVGAAAVGGAAVGGAAVGGAAVGGAAVGGAAVGGAAVGGAAVGGAAVGRAAAAATTESVTDPAGSPAGAAPAVEPLPAAPLPPLRPAPGDPSAALANLLDSLALDPDFAPARTLLLEEAEHAANGPWMPAYFAALDRLAEQRPADLEAGLALGDYRRLHFDEEGARELFLDVRDRAEAVEDGPLYAMASQRLAALASEAGRAEEAIAHLRAAVRFADDPALYLKLGVLLRDSDPVESMRALQRALALDKSPRVRLELGRSLLLVDEGERAMAELSRASQGSARDPEAAAEASDLLRVILLSAQEAAGE